MASFELWAVGVSLSIRNVCPSTAFSEKETRASKHVRGPRRTIDAADIKTSDGELARNIYLSYLVWLS